MQRIQEHTLALARELIARASVTPDDGGCLALLTQRLEAIGFRCERIDSNGVANVWARRGTVRPMVCLAGHVDVVPAGPAAAWSSEPFVPTEKGDGYLYGRGAADMKTSVACFVTAVERLVAQHPDHPGSIALLLTADEEGVATDGTVKVVQALRERGEAMDYCIVGEPTSSERLGDMLKNGRRGSLNGELRVIGVQGHVAYPHLASNPIHNAMSALNELVATAWDQGNAFFPPTSFQISNIHAGGGATNVVPGEMTVLFNFRFSTETTESALRATVHEVLDRHRVRYELSWALSGNPFLTGRGALLKTLSEEIFAVTQLSPEASTSGGTSDGRFIATLCPEVVEFGPVNASIHKANECVRVADIAPLSAIYQNTVWRLLQDTL